jgi:hypothetical protein
MEVTKREIIASISIIAIMLILGILISGKISEIEMDTNEKYNKALKITDSELFEYGMSTNVGNAFIYGELEAIDPVSYQEVDGEFWTVKKVKERYTQHTRTVTYTDSDGKTKTKTETYWSWDEVGREQLVAEKVKLLGIEFNTSQFDLPLQDYLCTIKESYYVRYKYYGYPAKSTVTIFSYLSNRNIESKNVSVYSNMDIDETIEYLEHKGGQVVFWILWIGLSVGAVYGFYYMDNRWLNRD